MTEVLTIKNTPKSIFILHQKEVVSATEANSIIEITTADTSFADGTSLALQPDGICAAFSGYKALYY